MSNIYDYMGGDVGPYGYSNQQNDPYSPYQNGPLPPWSYAGRPYDAMGNPIPLLPGMTLNSSPAQQAAAPPPAPAAPPPANSPMTGQLASNAAMQAILANQAQSQGPGSQFGGGGASSYGDPVGLAIRAHAPPPGYGPYGYSANQAAMGITPQIAAARAAAFGAPGASAQSIAAQEGPGGRLAAAPPGQQAAPAAAPATAPGAAPGGLTAQQYMQLRANPGPVPVYGATVPQASPGYQPSSGVLQQFLANWKPQTSGVGSGFSQAFAKALKGSSS